MKSIHKSIQALEILRDEAQHNLAFAADELRDCPRDSAAFGFAEGTRNSWQKVLSIIGDPLEPTRKGG